MSYELQVTSYKLRLLSSVFCLLSSVFCLPVFAQNNRLTNDKGQLLWQYNQNVTIDEEKSNTLAVTFVFINGIKQTAITLRQEMFHSQIAWVDSAGMAVGKEERIEFITTNLAPNQSMVLKYVVKTKAIDKELLLEKSAVLIMNEEFEIQKEAIPEQRYATK
jgi:hypothetical protein